MRRASDQNTRMENKKDGFGALAVRTGKARAPLLRLKPSLSAASGAGVAGLLPGVGSATGSALSTCSCVANLRTAPAEAAAPSSLRFLGGGDSMPPTAPVCRQSERADLIADDCHKVLEHPAACLELFDARCRPLPPQLVLPIRPAATTALDLVRTPVSTGLSCGWLCNVAFKSFDVRPTCSATFPRQATFSPEPPPSASSSAAARAFADGCAARLCRPAVDTWEPSDALELLGPAS